MHSNEVLGSDALGGLPADLQLQHQRSVQLKPVCIPGREIKRWHIMALHSVPSNWVHLECLIKEFVGLKFQLHCVSSIHNALENNSKSACIYYTHAHKHVYIYALPQIYCTHADLVGVYIQ